MLAKIKGPGAASSFENFAPGPMPPMAERQIAMNLLVLPSLRLFSRSLAALALSGLWLLPTATAQTNYGNYTFFTLAGQAPGWFDGAGPAARFTFPSGTALDSQGNCYLADSANHTIRKITPAGVVTTLAGLAGTAGSADGTGCAARFNSPRSLAVDNGGNVYVADSFNNLIRKITLGGVVSTLAGSAQAAGTNDGTGTAARFNFPFGLAVDNGGNVYVADTDNHTIRKVTPAGAVTTLAGLAGTAGSTNGTGCAACFAYPCGLTVDGNTNLYVADTYNYTIRKVTPARKVTTLAGLAATAGSADGTNSAARFDYPLAVTVDTNGNLYVADTYNHTIRKVTPAGVVTTVAGSAGSPGSADGTNSAARFNSPCGVALDGGGNLYVADAHNHTIRKVTLADGVVTTLAGTAAPEGSADGTNSAARFSYPAGVAVDLSANVYVADYANNTIRKITPDGVVTTLAGTPGAWGTNDGTNSAARFTYPAGVAVDRSGNVYVADYWNYTIRKVTPGGVVTTLAGLAGSSGSADGTGSAARFGGGLYGGPAGVAVDSAANVYVADTQNHTIRKITPDAKVSTLAGSAGPPGDNDGPGNFARFNFPEGLAVDDHGNVYVADTSNSTIRKVTPDGTVSTLAGTPHLLGANDGTGPAARFNYPFSVAVDSRGYLFVSDGNNHAIRMISPAGVVTTVGGTAGTTGGVDGTGPAASFWSPEGVTVDTDGNLYVANTLTHTIRKGSPALPDSPTIDLAFGPVGTTRHFAVTNLTTGASNSWTIVRYPAAAAAQLSSTTATNTTLTPDLPDLFVVRFDSSAGPGRAAIHTLLVATDTTPPTLSITTPAPGQQVSNSVFTVTGAANDDVVVSAVRCRLNGGDWTQAAGTVNWTNTVLLNPGSNTFSAYALDASGKVSATNTVRFRYVPVLTLQFSGAGTFSPTYSRQPMQIGKSYTISVTPANGYLFANWTDGAGHVLATTPKYKFTMTPDLILQANCIPNPFIPLKGTYAGLLADTNGFTSTNAGAFSATLTDRGSLSAKLQLSGGTYRLAGSFLTSGAYSNSIAGPGRSPLAVQLQLDLLGGSQTLTGLVRSSTWTADLLAHRAVYCRTNPAPQAARKYTLVIPGAVDPATGPGGYGFGTLTVDVSGNLSFSGLLGDGAKVTQASVLVGQGQWPFYLSPYAGKGLVQGWLQFLTNGTNQDITGQVSWLKLGGVPGKLYPRGFEFPDGVDVVGSLYTNGTPLLNWTDGHGLIELEGGNLSPAITNALTLGPNNKLSGTNKLSLTLTTTSGLFRGSVPGPGRQSISVSGVLLQKWNEGYGLFLGTTNSGSVHLGPQR